MGWDIVRVMDQQHRRLDWLLGEAVGDQQRLDAGAYTAFRETMLRHIGIEEKVLLAGLREAGVPWSRAAAIHREHAAFAALLAGEPDLAVALEVDRLFTQHLRLEEGPEGLFATCQRALSAEVLVVSAHAYPRVRPAPWSKAPWIPRTVETALELADGRLTPR